MPVADSIEDLLAAGSDSESQTSETLPSGNNQVDILLKPLVYEELGVKSDVEYVCSDISHRINALYRLSMLIRSPATPGKTHKYAAIDVTHFEKYERERIAYKYETKLKSNEAKLESEEAKSDEAESKVKLPQFLVDRLALANLRRRQIFTYANEHQAKIATNKTSKQSSSNPKVAIGHAGHAALSIAPTSAILSETTATAFQDSGALAPMNTCMPPVDPEIPQAINTPTGVVNYQALRDTLSVPCNTMSEDGVSQTSSMASSVVSSEVGDSGGIPMSIPLPLGKEKLFGGKPTYFECPFCFRILRLRNRKQWRWVPF